MKPKSDIEFLFATADTFRPNGTKLLFDGQSEYTEKSYKKLASATYSAGDRVLVMKVNGTYLILGRVLPKEG